jgi:hypothetical protein
MQCTRNLTQIHIFLNKEAILKNILLVTISAKEMCALLKRCKCKNTVIPSSSDKRGPRPKLGELVT